MKVKVGQWVAFNMLDDAVWFEVEKIDGFNMRVREGEEYAAQFADTSMVKQVRDTKPKQGG